MKSFTERNPITVGIVGVAVVIAAVLAATLYDKLPFINTGKHYSAFFTEAGGLSAGAPVQVAGYRVGEVSDVTLDGPRVRVDFVIDRSIRLGERTEAAIKTKTLLGARVVEVSPRGDGQLSEPISTDRTTSPYDLTEALGDLTTTVKGLDTTQLNDSLTTLTELFRNTPGDFQAAVAGIAKFSDALGKRDDQLRRLLANANNVTGVLRDRSDQIVSLVSDTDALLEEFQNRSAALDQVSSNISALAQQLSGLVADNKTTLRPALEKLNGVLGMLDNNKKGLQESIKLLSQYALSLGEAVASGPFFKAYQVNLIPGQLMQPFVDAAFSDLGLDPSTLLPSQLSDPEVGQPATPPLPMPYPRTGQGGDPRLTLPDAITGNPGDPRYPYDPPPPQPAPGGPPPGPPAGYDPEAPVMTSEPTSAEVSATPTPNPPLPGATP